MSKQHTLVQMSHTGGRRNLIINGAMQVAQRGTSKTGITGTSYPTVDRFKFSLDSCGTWTSTQEDDAPDGFASSCKIECTTADASISSSDYVILQHILEGQDLQQLQYGTSSAKDITISFWVKSNKTGTYTLELQTDGSEENPIQYSVNSSGVWEYKSLTFSGNTSDSLSNDNTLGLVVNWWVAAGSTWAGGTYNENTWQNTNANRAVGNLNLADTVGNYFQITGVQLEVGDVATPFEHRSYGEELALCQRYFERLTSTSNMDCIADGHMWNTTAGYGKLNWSPKRADPTVTFGSASSYRIRCTGSNRTAGAIGVDDARKEGFGRVYITISSGTLPAGNGCWFSRTTNSTHIDVDAEL